MAAVAAQPDRLPVPIARAALVRGDLLRSEKASVGGISNGLTIFSPSTVTLIGGLRIMPE